MNRWWGPRNGPCVKLSLSLHDMLLGVAVTRWRHGGATIELGLGVLVVMLYTGGFVDD